MQSPYLLFQKDTVVFFTKTKIEIFFFSELITGSKPQNSVSQFDEYRKKINFIFNKLLQKIESQIKGELVLLFDYPWTKTVFLSMPWLSERRIKKIIQFELQKKSWQDNLPMEQDFYTIPDKEKKKKRVIAYSMEKQQIASISNLLLQKKITLISVTPYSHLLEQGVQSFIKKRKKKDTLVIVFTNKYASCYFYDKVGLKAFYPLAIKKAINQSFWMSFKVLVQRISLFHGNNFDIFYKNKEKYILLDTKKKYSEIALDTLSYAQVNKQYQIIQKSLDLIPDKLKWSFSYGVNRFMFFKKKLALSGDSFFARFFVRVQFIILFSVAVFLMTNILNLKTKKLDSEIELKKKIYQKYLNAYQLNPNVVLENVDANLKNKIQEWQMLNKQQEKFLQKSYTFSDILLFLARSKGNTSGLEITRLELEQNQFTLIAKATENIFQEFKKSLSNYFNIVDEKYNSNNNFIIKFTRK